MDEERINRHEWMQGSEDARQAYWEWFKINGEWENDPIGVDGKLAVPPKYPTVEHWKSLTEKHP